VVVSDNNTPTPERTLLPAHVQQLARSGIEETTARAAGLYSETDPGEIARLLGWGGPAVGLGPCLVFPYFEADGTTPMTFRRADGSEAPFVRLRPETPRLDADGREVKYESPAGSTTRLYIPPGIAEVLADASAALDVVEGEKKALCEVQNGRPAVGIGGVWGWVRGRPEDAPPGGPYQLNDDLLALPWGGRRVNSIFDSDSQIRSDLNQALYAFARTLQAQGARVFIIPLPQGLDNRNQGPDDYVVRCGIASLTNLVNSIRTPLQRRRPQVAGGQQYLLENGCLSRRTAGRDGAVTISPMCDFSAAIVADVIYDDGAGNTRVEAEITGRLDDGTALPTLRVPASEFKSMNWFASQWGLRATVDAGLGTQDHVRAAISRLSRMAGYPRRRVYECTGWEKVEGHWMFLHAGGAIHAPGVSMPQVLVAGVPVPAVSVDLGNELNGKFVLPEPPVGEDLVAAVKASLALVDHLPVEGHPQPLAPDSVTFALLGAIYRVVLGPVDFSIHLNGSTGKYKSELTSLAQRHFGRTMERLALPGNWSTTANSLEAVAHKLRNCVFTIDDYSPEKGKMTSEDLQRKAERILRAQGNQAGRGRLDSHLNQRPTKYPRGMVLSSGEDLPRGSSIRARVFNREVGDGAVNLARLSACQEDAKRGLYDLAMAGFLSWYASRYETAQRELRQRVDAFRHSKEDDEHARTPGIVADLLLGLDTFFKFAVEVGATTQEEVDARMKRGRDAMTEAGREQAEGIIDTDSVFRFPELITAAISAGRAHVTTRDGAPPENAGAWGWDMGGDRPRPRGDHIGCLDEKGLYLFGTVAYAAAQDMATRLKDPLTIDKGVLWRRLDAAGLVASRPEKNRRGLMVSQRTMGRVLSVLHLRPDALDGHLECPPGNPPNDTQARSSTRGCLGGVIHVATVATDLPGEKQVSDGERTSDAVPCSNRSVATPATAATGTVATEAAVTHDLVKQHPSNGPGGCCFTEVATEPISVTTSVDAGCVDGPGSVATVATCITPPRHPLVESTAPAPVQDCNNVQCDTAPALPEGEVIGDEIGY
jgi:hypothetical protein